MLCDCQGFAVNKAFYTLMKLKISRSTIIQTDNLHATQAEQNTS